MENKIKDFIKDSFIEKTSYLENYPDCYQLPREERQIGENCLYTDSTFKEIEDVCKLRLNTISKPWSSAFGYLYKFKNGNNVEIQNFKGQNVNSIILKIEISTNKINDDALDYDIEGNSKNITDIKSLLKESKIQNDIFNQTRDMGLPICPEIYSAGYLTKDDFLKVFEDNETIKHSLTSDLNLIFSCIQEQIFRDYTSGSSPGTSISKDLKYRDLECKTEDFLYISYCFMESIEGKHFEELHTNIKIMDNDNTISEEDKNKFKIKDKELLYIGEHQHISGIVPLFNYFTQVDLLHDCGYVHNDLKGDNIIYNNGEIYDDFKGYSWIIDYGLTEKKEGKEYKSPSSALKKIEDKISPIITNPIEFEAFVEQGKKFLKEYNITLQQANNDYIIQEDPGFNLDNYPTDNLIENMLSCKNYVNINIDKEVIQFYQNMVPGLEKENIHTFLVNTLKKESEKMEREKTSIKRQLENQLKVVERLTEKKKLINESQESIQSKISEINKVGGKRKIKTHKKFKNKNSKKNSKKK